MLKCGRDAIKAPSRLTQLTYDLAIVGGGPAGLFSALAAQSFERARCVWIRGPRLDFGPAYATTLDVHVLNVPAERMGAYPEQPDHFHRWLQKQALQYAQDAYVPRALYGHYLADLAVALDADVIAAIAMAAKYEAGVWRVELDDGTAVCARALILALGPPRAHGDAWDWLLSLPHDWTPPPPSATIALKGSGLTAVDMALALRALGFAGNIHAFSRSGAWPCSHERSAALEIADADRLVQQLAAATSAVAVVATLASAVRCSPWRAVIDALRPHSQRLWSSWPPAIQGRLLRHGLSLWNRHRHRMAPEIAQLLAADDRLILSRTPPSSAAFTLDCTGFPFHEATTSPLIQSLVAAGHVGPHALGFGVAPPDRDDLALIGGLLFGALIETTAIPELRTQAWTAVPQVLGHRAG